MWAQALQSSTPWVFGISGNQQAHLLLSLMYPTARNVEKLAEMEHKLQGCWLLNSIPANHITGLITQKQLCQSHNAWRQKAPQSKQGFLIKLYHSVKQLRSGATGKWFVFLFFFFLNFYNDRINIEAIFMTASIWAPRALFPLLPEMALRSGAAEAADLSAYVSCCLQMAAGI